MVSLERCKRSLPDCGAALLLFGLNAWLAWRLFTIEYTQHFNSIEGSFIGLARYISRHFGHFSWWPIWHCGMPYQDTYVPLVHLTAGLTAMGTGASAAHAYHTVTGVTYCLAPVSLYLAARKLGAVRMSALFCGLVFSVFSPSAVMIPAYAKDLGNALFPRRLQVLTVYGEGPHVTAIAFLPIVILALENAIRKRTRRSFALAALCMALVFVTNVPGTMALGLAVFCWICIQGRDMIAGWKLAAGAAALGYAVACFGVPPSSLGTVFGNVGPMHTGFSESLRHAPYLLPLVLAAVGVGAFFVARTNLPVFVRFGLTYFVLTAILVFTSRDHVKFELLPQVGRLHLEMELGACLVLGWLLWLLYRWSWTRYAVIGFGALALAYQIHMYRGWARWGLTPQDPAAHSEYTSARWIGQNLGGRRVYAAGSTSFWLNAFTDTPQVLGCCDQGLSMPSLAALPYLIHGGVTPEYTRLGVTWLQAFGVHALVVNGPDSDDDYKDYKQPERFGQVLTPLHQERGDTIYRIPQRSDSLVHVLHAGEAVPGPPVLRIPTEPLQRYVDAIEDPARIEAQTQWLDPANAHIRARLKSGDQVSVQVTYYSGWQATVGGASRPVEADGIGFLLIRPQCEGDCEIDLRWTGRWDLYLSAFISVAGLAVTGLLLWRGR